MGENSFVQNLVIVLAIFFILGVLAKKFMGRKAEKFKNVFGVVPKINFKTYKAAQGRINEYFSKMSYDSKLLSTIVKNFDDVDIQKSLVRFPDLQEISQKKTPQQMKKILQNKIVEIQKEYDKLWPLVRAFKYDVPYIDFSEITRGG